MPWPCRFFHSWRTALDNGIDVYRECRRCGQRDCYRKPGASGYTGGHHKWLEGRTDDINDVDKVSPLLPRGGSVASQG